jgi:tetratricopeptide (TPR) repeat protein
MRSFRYYSEIAFGFCVLALLVGCAASPLQKADKLAMSDPESAIAVYRQAMQAKPGSEEAQQAHLGIANTYYERMDDHQKGLEVYEEIAKAYPKTQVSGEANWALGMHYFQAKDYGKAREKFAKVTEEIPGTTKADDAALAIGKCYEELKKYEDAAKLYEEFSKTHPTHRRAAQAGLDAARIYDVELGKTDEAIETYKNVASEYSLSSSGREARQALTDLGVDISDLSELPEAETQQTQTEPETAFGMRTRRRARNIPRAEIGSGQRTEEQRSRTVSPDFGLDPMDLMPIMSMDSQGTLYDAMYMFANMNLQSAEYKEAGTLYERAIQLAPSTWDNAARAYFGLAKSYRGIGMDDKAKEMFREAIKRDSKTIDSMIVTGETYYGDEEYEEALEAYETALGLVPHKDYEIYYDIGLVYQKLGDADKELEAFERAVALKPSFADAVQHLAEVLFYRKKDATRAELYDNEARGKGSTDYKVQKELGDLCYRYGYEFSKEEDRAKQSDSCYSWAKIKYNNAARNVRRRIDNELEEAVKSGDQSEAKQIVDDPAKVTLKLVLDAAASGNQLALKALENVAPLLADYRLVSSRVAICQARMGQYDQAQQQLDELRDDDPNAPDSADFHYALGELALAQGNKDAGLTEIRKALEIDPEHKEAADRLKGLDLGSPSARSK